MKITSALLKRKGACLDQRRKFAELFPGGVIVTEALCVEHASVFNWEWAAENLLPPSAWAEYGRVTAPAWAEYERVTAPALAGYGRARASAWAEYKRVTASTFGSIAAKLETSP